MIATFLFAFFFAPPPPKVQIFEGTLQSVSAKSMVLIANDTRQLEITITSATVCSAEGKKLECNALKEDDGVRVEAVREEDVLRALKITRGTLVSSSGSDDKADPDGRPRLKRSGGNSGSTAGAKTKTEQKKQQLEGWVREASPEKIVLVSKDSREYDLQIGKDTACSADDKKIECHTLKREDYVQVEAVREEDAMRALRIARADPPEEPIKTTTVRDPEEQGTKPKLRRGKPAPKPKSSDDDDDAPGVVIASAPLKTEQPDATPAEPAPSPAKAPVVLKASAEDELIRNAGPVNLDFSEHLPDFICAQNTARYYKETRKDDWHLIDLVSADISMNKGKESYDNLKINGKVPKKSVEKESTWSYGEFGTALKMVFSPASAADFQFTRHSNIAGKSAKVYTMAVEQPHSSWRIQEGPQSIYPAYTGSVWVDVENARTLRVEMQAKKIPEDFPIDHVEWAIDYGMVRISGKEYLLPTHAENIACWRGSSRCTRNVLEFRNYRKFSTESTVYNTESTIDFGDPDAPQKPDPKSQPKNKKK